MLNKKAISSFKLNGSGGTPHTCKRSLLGQSRNASTRSC